MTPSKNRRNIMILLNQMRDISHYNQGRTITNLEQQMNY